MLQVNQLSVSYGETAVVRGVDLEVGSGKVVCLMGRNGVGKTTLLKAIMGLLPSTAGRVSMAGVDLTRSRPEARAWQGIGYVPQGREIFPQLTVLENLRIGLVAHPRGRRDVPEEIFGYFPMLRTMLARKGGMLSGGQQQQLAIARALVAEPKLLILDEPTEGIQPSIITLIGEVLGELKSSGRMSVLLVEQYLEFALGLADHYYVMEKGTVVMHGDSTQMDPETIKPYLAF